jgi:AAA+ ATPase superfamily predicted ATPase
MKFYGRKNELSLLKKLEKMSQHSSKMSIVIGRRRIGKTTLIKEAFPEKLYFFVSKKSESLLCEEFVSIIEETLKITVHGKFDNFSSLFSYLMDLAKDRNFTLVIDEFQEFLQINPSLYSGMQNIWDGAKDNSKMNLVLCGSIYSLMKRIFEDKKEPLFGRADAKINLKAFDINTLKVILHEHYPKYSNDDLLTFYMLTGGVAKYVEIFVNNEAYNFEKQLDMIFDEFSLFLDEGKNLLIEEFGKEYTTYFSILSLLASSKTSRSEIESILEKNIGGFLDRLENEYSIIRKIRPIFAKNTGRIVKYEIADNFFNFWFRFIYKHKSAIELENYDYVKNIVRRDYKTYSGKFLERFFQDKFKLSYQYSEIGTYWEKGNTNEIDIIAINEEEKTLLIAEVKRNKKKIDLTKLENKAARFLVKKNNYQVNYQALSLEDM